MQNGLQRVSFQRSGGSFHMVLSGTVEFSSEQATVSSAPPAASRTLSPDETSMFAQLDIPALRSWSASSPQAGQPDRYQYDVTLEIANADPVSLRFHEGSTGASGQPVAGLGDLAAWVRSETAALWKQKTAPRA
jgi:hypothetical protein